MVGTCGSASVRAREPMASARNLPALSCSTTAGSSATMADTCAPSSAFTAGAVPLYGTYVRLTLLARLSFSKRWHEWVVLIAGSTGSALRAVRPPNLHITPVVRRDLVYAASATGSLYRSPLAIMAQAIRAILLASAMAATLVGRRPNNAVSQGRCPVPWILA